jgi:hypothetical protein
MTILNKNMLPCHGPYIDLLYSEYPLEIDEDDWPLEEDYAQDIFFKLADDLLGDWCVLTSEYSPFDPYEYTILSNSSELQTLADVFAGWAKKIEQLPDDYIKEKCQFLYDSSKSTASTGSAMKRDLIETLEFIVKYILKAKRLGHTIAIVGI